MLYVEFSLAGLAGSLFVRVFAWWVALDRSGMLGKCHGCGSAIESMCVWIVSSRENILVVFIISLNSLGLAGVGRLYP